MPGPARQAAWRLDEYDDGLFTHCLVRAPAQRSRHEDRLRRRDRRRRAGRRERGDPAGAGRLVGRAGRAAALPAAQGLRRMHRGEQPAAARRARRRRRVRAPRRCRAAPGRAAARRRDVRRRAAAGRDDGRTLRPGARPRASRHAARRTLPKLPARRGCSPGRCRGSTAAPGASPAVRAIAVGGATLELAGRRSSSPRTARGSRCRRSARSGARRARRAICSRSRRISRDRDRGRSIAGALVSRRLRAAWSSPTTAWPRSPAAFAKTDLRNCRAAQPGDRARGRRRRGDAAARMRRRRRRARSRRRARARGSPAGRSGPACASARTTASFASATPPARRIRSSAKASAWRCNRRSSSRALLGRREPVSSGRPASAGRGTARALAAYETLWRRRFARRLHVAAAFAHIAMRPALARAAWPLARRWPGVLTEGARLSGKTRCAPEAARLVGVEP